MQLAQFNRMQMLQTEVIFHQSDSLSFKIIHGMYRIINESLLMIVYGTKRVQIYPIP